MRPIKVFMTVLASFVALLVLAVAALVLLFDPNDYKSYLTDWVEQRTGRPLTVTGDLELEFFPWLAIETGGVSLGSSEGFGTDEPFATVERIAAEVKLIPLLSKRVEIGTLRLEGLRLNLARDAAGRGNWEDLAGADGADGPARSGDSEQAWMQTLDAEGLRIRDGLVHWREDGELRYVASGIVLETGAITRGAPVDVSLVVDVLDVESQRSFEVEAQSGVLLTDGPADGSADGPAVELRDFGFGLRLVDGQRQEVGEGRLDAALVQAAADGRIEIAGARVAGRLPGVSSAPDGMSFGGQWRLAVLDFVVGSLQIDELATDVAGIEAQWQLEGRNLIDAPEIEGSVMVRSESIADALAAFDIALPSGVEPGTLGTLDATADFRLALAPPNSGPGGGAAGASGSTFEIGPYRLTSMSLSAVNARTLGLALRGEAELVDGATVRARLDIPEFTANEALLGIARAHAPDTIDVRAFERLAFSSGVEADLDSGRVTLRNTRAALLGAELNGSLEIRPESGGKVYRGALKTTRFEPDRLALFLGDLLSDGLAPDEIGTLAFDGRFDYDTRSDRIALEQLALEAFGLTATGTATVSNLGGSPVATGKARVTAFSPRDLMRRFDQAAPDTSDDAALRSASIDATFAVDTGNGRFTDIALVLDNSRITGDFTVSNFQDPGYSFELAIDEVNADRYLPPRAVDAPADAPEDAPTAGDIELPMEALNNLNLNGRVGVGALRLAGLDFQDVATNIAIGNGSGSLDSARAKLYGGEFAGSFKVAVDGGQPGLTLTGRATGLTLEPMIVALTGDANFSGRGDFDLNLSGRGATVIENVRSANGNVSFALEAGAIQGFNLGRTLCSVYNATRKLPAPAEQAKATAYEIISGTASVKEGVASSPDLLARTSFMDVTGGGSLGLAEQRLDYDLDAKLTGSIGIPGCESMDGLIGDSIPFTLRGTVTDPDIRPDFSAIIQRRIKEEIQDRIGERLQDRLRDLLQ